MSSGAQLWRAPAKVNLTLHIVGRDEDGWHELDSIVAFAGCSDWLRFWPGEKLSLSVDGPCAASAGDCADNLVLKTAFALASRVANLRLGRFHLTKNLPVAAGLGGGSADAAAALRALAHTNGLALDDPNVREAAIVTGSDVPVCLEPSARVMQGRGEKLGQLLCWPPICAVLANPGMSVSTKQVFARIGLALGEGLSAPVAPPPTLKHNAILAALAGGRNDMEGAARTLAPVIGEVLETLAAMPGARLARMSGSGATCFALFDDRQAAARTAHAIARKHPGWWVRATALR